jgi:hypothetical protein
MLESEVGIEAVQYFLGHRSITTTTRYATPSLEAMRRVLEVLPSIIKKGGIRKGPGQCDRDPILRGVLERIGENRLVTTCKACQEIS